MVHKNFPPIQLYFSPPLCCNYHILHLFKYIFYPPTQIYNYRFVQFSFKSIRKKNTLILSFVYSIYCKYTRVYLPVQLTLLVLLISSCGFKLLSIIFLLQPEEISWYFLQVRSIYSWHPCQLSSTAVDFLLFLYPYITISVMSFMIDFF